MEDINKVKLAQCEMAINYGFGYPAYAPIISKLILKEDIFHKGSSFKKPSFSLKILHKMV